ncbi:hypothetical protein ACGFNY_44210 [Streptomyces chartreusis]|uniref:hypothetical protein n=1 Tax=Streptomyces chartreusis TaxID=1969 RepID=UPI003718BF64
MTAVVRSLFRTTTVDAQPTSAEPVDYCQCGRGAVIGVVSYTDSRLTFYSLEDWYCRHVGEAAADLRCVDCLADTALDVANGVVREQMREKARERAADIDALMRTNAMRREAGLPIIPGIFPEGCDEWPSDGLNGGQ